MKDVLIVIDMQKDFLTGALANAKADSVTKNVKEKILQYRELGKEVIFTRDTHASNYMETQEGKKLPILHCVKGTDGWEIVDGFVQPQDKIFDKPYRIETAQVCRHSGLLASTDCDETYTEYYLRKTVPKNTCINHKAIVVDTPITREDGFEQ